jgi:hypothetical protein
MCAYASWAGVFSEDEKKMLMDGVSARACSLELSVAYFQPANSVFLSYKSATVLSAAYFQPKRTGSDRLQELLPVGELRWSVACCGR